MGGWEIAAMVALMVGSYLLTSMLTPKPRNAAPNTLADFDFPRWEEGTPQTVIFGDCWTGDWMILWYGDLRVNPLRNAAGGKK